MAATDTTNPSLKLNPAVAAELQDVYREMQLRATELDREREKIFAMMICLWSYWEENGLERNPELVTPSLMLESMLDEFSNLNTCRSLLCIADDSVVFQQAKSPVSIVRGTVCA